MQFRSFPTSIAHVWLAPRRSCCPCLVVPRSTCCPCLVSPKSTYRYRYSPMSGQPEEYRYLLSMSGQPEEYSVPLSMSGQPEEYLLPMWSTYWPFLVKQRSTLSPYLVRTRGVLVPSYCPCQDNPSSNPVHTVLSMSGQFPCIVHA